MRLIQNLFIFILIQTVMCTILMADSISIKEYLFEKQIEGTIPVFHIQYTLNFNGIESAAGFITTLGKTVTMRKYSKEAEDRNILCISMTPQFIQSNERGDALSLIATIDTISGNSEEEKINLFDGKLNFFLDEEPTIIKSYETKKMSLQLKAKKMFMYKHIVEELSKRNSCPEAFSYESKGSGNYPYDSFVCCNVIICCVCGNCCSPSDNIDAQTPPGIPPDCCWGPCLL